MAEEINKTYTSNSLYNDSTGVIAFAEQLKQELINWANYQHVTEELGQNRPDLQNELNNLFLSVYERFLTFLNDADASEEAINTWKEIENFLADYTDEKTLASIVAELNNKIESRLAVPLENTTGSSTTSTMTQKAITETINASKTFTTGEKVDNVGIDSEPTAGSNNLVKSDGVASMIGSEIKSGSKAISETGDLYTNPTLGYLIPNGTKLFIRCTGIGTIVSRLKVIFGTNVSDPNQYIYTNETEIIAPTDFSVLRVMVYSSDDIIVLGGTVSVLVSYFGLEQKIERTKESLSEINVNSFNNTSESYTLSTAINSIPENDRKNGLKLTFFDGTNWKTYVFIGSSISDWNTNTCWYPCEYVSSVYFKTTPEYVHKRLKELYLTGLDNQQEYQLSLCDVHNGSVRLRIADSNGTTVARASTSTFKGISVVESINDSGISGYAVVNFDETDTTNLFSIPILINSIVSNIDYSPTIKAKLVSDKIPTITNVATGQQIDSTGIVTSFTDTGDANISSAKGIANLAETIVKNEIPLGGSSMYGVIIGSDGKYSTLSGGGIGSNFKLEKNSILEVKGHSSRSTFLCFLEDYDNMVDGQSAHIVSGTSVVEIPANTVVRLTVPIDCYLFSNYKDASNQTCYLQYSKVLKSIGSGILFENCSDTKQILKGSVKSASSGTANIIPNTSITSIPAGTKIKISVTGIGTYYSYFGYSLNGGSTVYSGESVVEIVPDVAVTSIRVLCIASAYIAEGTVTATVETDDLGNVIKKAVQDIKDIKNEIAILNGLNIDVEDLKNAAGITTNVFTESFSLAISNQKLKESNIIISSAASYSTSNDSIVPTIQIYDNILSSNRRQPYIVGGKDTKEFKQWRYPILIGNTNTITISFNIPSGVELTIDSFAISSGNSISREDGIKMFEHSGYWGSTFNAKLGFSEANVGGFYGAIVVPKLTTDGVFVCYHDDGTLADNNDLQMVGGDPLTPELGALKMNELTFAQTQLLEYKATNILGEHSRIPTLEEFFINCAKTGVHPCLSCHPTYTVANWTKIKNLAAKHNLLDKLTIKHSPSVNEAEEVYQAFGNSIEMYLWDISTSTINDYITNLQSLSFDETKVKLGLEFMSTDYAIGALSDIDDLINLGYVWGFFENTPSVVNLKKLINAGCYEATVGAFYSSGLNW